MRTERLAEYRAMLEGQLAELLGHGEATVHEMAAPGDELTDPNDRATRESDTISELRMHLRVVRPLDLRRAAARASRDDPLHRLQARSGAARAGVKRDREASSPSR
jgi:hypothetical protein